jgi:hypothetical protein
MPMLCASLTSRATTGGVRSLIRVLPSPRCTKAARNLVQARTSNNRTGRSILGGHLLDPAAQPGRRLRFAEQRPRRTLLRLGLLISQKFHRHAADGSHAPRVIEDLPLNPRTGPIIQSII